MKRLFDALRSLLSPSARQPRRGVVVYTEPGCRCSQSAIELLRSEGVEPTVLPLEEHQEIRSEFGAATPIVQVDGRVRFFGRVDAVLLKRLLAHRRRQG